MSTRAPVAAKRDRDDADRLQREWWEHVLGVLRAPQPVFRAMRDDSRGPAEARSEPALAILLLAGTASVLSFSATSREFLDQSGVDGALVPVLAFLGGAIYGIAGYWLGGLALYLGIRGAKGEGSYRQARHALAYGLVPLALSLLLWPIRVAAFGGDNFRAGGSDEGAGYWAFTGVALVFLCWSLAVLVIGVRELHGWTTLRSVGALVLTGLALLGIAVFGLVVTGP